MLPQVRRLPSAPGVYRFRDGRARVSPSFGPYLGGLRARQAAAALHRLHPLSYAASTLTDAEREMAERGARRIARGHRPLSLAELILKHS